jgi:hypothetical protein
MIVTKVRRNYAWVESKAGGADDSPRGVGQGEIGSRLSSNWVQERGVRVTALIQGKAKEA